MKRGSKACKSLVSHGYTHKVCQGRTSSDEMLCPSLSTTWTRTVLRSEVVLEGGMQQYRTFVSMLGEEAMLALM